MKKINLVLAMLALPALLITSTSLNAASFDCKKAQSLIEHTICNDEKLSKLDEDLAKAYKNATQYTDENSLKKEQIIWIKTGRAACKDVECLQKSYAQRIGQLLDYSAKNSGNNAEAPIELVVENKVNNANAETDAKNLERAKQKSAEDQLKFVNVVMEYATGFKGVKNELQQSAMRDQRKLKISSTLGGYSVNSWIGTIKQLKTNTDGKAILSVSISPDIEIKTWNNSLSDTSDNTLIEKGDPIYSVLLNLSSGQRVVFSGEFFPSETDFIKETSMTISGSMTDPEFLFKFKSVTPIPTFK